MTPHRQSLRVALALAGTLLAGPGQARAAEPARPVFRAGSFKAHLEFLASDALEGRGIGSRGGRLAAAYLQAVLAAAGLEPGLPGGFRQPFLMTAYSPDPAARLSFEAAAGATLLAGGEDFVVIAFGIPGGELVAQPLFIGYGITAPAERWDDLKGADVRGRLLVCLANEPGRDDPGLFRGRELTLAGRWRSKLDDAARRGAAGLLLVHTEADAGYAWDVVRNSWTRDAFRLTSADSPLPVAGWLSERSARALLRAAGLDLDELRQQAERRTFVPLPVPLTVRINAATTTRTVEGANVVAVLPGAGADAVLLTAHYDHLGLGRAVAGDAIYNGAVDNASALATLLSLAEGFARTPRDSHPPLVIVAADAEEEGLLGSLHYALHPALPLDRTLAAMNFEMSNVWGRTRDVLGIGASHSELDDALAAVLAGRGLRLTADPAPEQGYFFRSDQLAYAQAGVPAVWLDGGVDYVGRPPGWGERARATYRANAYHRPSDEVMPDFDYTGLVQLAEIAADLVHEIGARGHIAWKPRDEFHRRTGR